MQERLGRAPAFEHALREGKEVPAGPMKALLDRTEPKGEGNGPLGLAASSNVLAYDGKALIEM